MSETLLSPVGRFVQGDPFKGRTTDMKGNPLLVKSGPNIGQPKTEFYVGVAYSKTDPNTQSDWVPYRASLDRIAKLSFPLLFPDAPLPGQPFHVGPGGGAIGCTNPQFSWKIIDGDGFDDNGQPWSKREGFAGHWVVRYNSGYASKVFPVGRHSPLDAITAEQSHLLRRGYYVRVYTEVTGNKDDTSPGLYHNLNLVELVAQGVEIRGGVDAAEAFAAPVNLPAGAVALPGAPVAVVGAPQVVPPITNAVYAPVPPTPAPAPTVVAPPPAPSAPPATPSPTRLMTAAAKGLTYEQYVAAGWTEAQLIASGLLAV